MPAHGLGGFPWTLHVRQGSAGTDLAIDPLHNFRLFDGTSSSLRDGLFLLVDGTRIKEVGTGTPATPEGARVIHCGGRVIMPGLIDSHWHAVFAGLPLPVLMQGDPAFIALAVAEEAERTLMRGFTTIRAT